MFELNQGESWTPFLEEINTLMISEKTIRHENDHIKSAEVCLRIVSANLLDKRGLKFGYLSLDLNEFRQQGMDQTQRIHACPLQEKGSGQESHYRYG